MKTLIFLHLFTGLTVLSLSQSQPTCITKVNDKISSLENAIIRLNKIVANGNNREFKNAFTGLKSKPKSLRKSLADCKSANPDFDYSEIEAKVEEAIGRFDATVKRGEDKAAGIIAADNTVTSSKAAYNTATTGTTAANSVSSVAKSSSDVSKDAPHCNKYVLRKIEMLDEASAKLEKCENDKDFIQFNNYLNQFKSKKSALTEAFEKCKNEAPNYDHSSVAETIAVAISRYDSVEKRGEAEIEKNNNIEQYIYKFGAHIRGAVDFPRTYLMPEEMEGLTSENTKAILAAINEGNLRQSTNLKEDYEEALTTFKSSEFENRAYQEIDFHYAMMDKQEGLKVLNRYLSTLSYYTENVFLNNHELTKIQSYLQSLVSKMGSAKAKSVAAILVSDFHGEQLNKILFTSNMSLNPETATASDFETSFEAGQDILAVAYLDNTFHKIYGRTNSPAYRMLGTINSGNISVDGYEKSAGSKPYVTFKIIQDAGSYTAKPGTYAGVVRAMEYLASFPPRAQSIEVELDSDFGTAQGEVPDSDVVGSFTFDASNDAGLDKMKKNIAGIRDKDFQNVSLPKAGMNNGQFEAELVSVFNSIGWDEKFTRAIIGSSDFGYKKNVLDQVVGRTLQVYMVSQKSDGGCMYQDFTVIQDKVGSGWSGFKRLSTGSQKDFSCSKL